MQLPDTESRSWELCGACSVLHYVAQRNAARKSFFRAPQPLPAHQCACSPDLRRALEAMPTNREGFEALLELAMREPLPRGDAASLLFWGLWHVGCLLDVRQLRARFNGVFGCAPCACWLCPRVVAPAALLLHHVTDAFDGAPTSDLPEACTTHANWLRLVRDTLHSHLSHHCAGLVLALVGFLG